jgi:hypothetical protein
MLLGILGCSHDRKVCDDEIKEAVMQIARLLVPGGTAIVFCCRSDIARWESQFELEPTMYIEVPLYVSVRVLTV